MQIGKVAAVFLAASLVSPTAGLAQELSERLATANAEVGEAKFRQCKACHTIDEGGANRTGPNLYGVVGRDVGRAEGFRYSPAMGEAGGQWTPEALDAFLESPRDVVPGTRMTFRGISDPADRADVIAYLNTQSAAPLVLGESYAEAEETQGAADQFQDGDFGRLVVADGVDVVFYTCTACHSEMIVIQQGKDRDHWDKLLDWMIEEQGMSEPAQADRDIILDYLAEYYNTDRPNFPN